MDANCPVPLSLFAVKRLATGLAFLASCVAAQPASAVRVWQDTISLPTYAERDPDPFPQFAAFSTDGPANYPYPLRNGVNFGPASRTTVAWRTLNLENQYLFCRKIGRAHV